MSVDVVGGTEKENTFGSSFFETPRKEPECSKPVLDYFSGTGLLDDDFDESILEEIDNLCKQKSGQKEAVQQELDCGRSCGEVVLSESNVVRDVDLSTASKGIGSGELVSYGVGLEPKEEQMDTYRDSLQSSNMPEEYLKYLQNLNERQREAACTDISTPLMIVAGPGSGKVFSFFFSSWSIAC